MLTFIIFYFVSCLGLVGARYDGIENVIINDLVIRDLTNESPLVSAACGSYMGENDGGSPGQEHDEGGMGTDVRGIAISRGDVEFRGDGTIITGLYSYYGDVIGLDIFNNASVYYDIGANVIMGNLSSATSLTVDIYRELKDNGRTPFPNNFYVCTVNIENWSYVIGEFPEGKNTTHCIDGETVMSNRGTNNRGSDSSDD